MATQGIVYANVINSVQQNNITDDEITCVVAVCVDCGKAVIYKYVKNFTGSPFIVGTGGPAMFIKPDIEWCSCGSNELRHLCKVGASDNPGFLDKCDRCVHKFACASCRIDIVWEGFKNNA